MKAKFILTVDLPENYTKTEFANYIREAVNTWKGCKDPEDPIFDLKRVTVKPMKELQ